MAPQKTMAISQQQQSQQQTTGPRNQNDQASKSKKRKGKQQSTNNSALPPALSQVQQNVVANSAKQQVINTKPVESTIGRGNPDPKIVGKQPSDISEKQQPRTTASAAKDKASVKQQSNEVQSSHIKEPVKVVEANKQKDSLVSSNTILSKQLSTDEPDEIDAGIELDGSSNSGSSVKDINEDQIKSASVSPIMAQNRVATESRGKSSHHVGIAPIEQSSSSSVNDAASAHKKTGLTTKEQLAANQQVIDADERQLQQKLQNKQRKPSLQGNTSTSSLNSNNTIPSTPQSPALCKVCGQHVYQMERAMAEKSLYHKSCFRCFQCKTQLRVDNYSSHEGQVYCKAHHRQLFQPQVKMDNEVDVDIVAKSTSKKVDEYLLHRGRLSDLSYSFLRPKSEGILKRQMIICENEPTELPKDVVRSDTKVDDGIDRLNLNLNNILEKFERGNGEESPPSSAGIVIDKPSVNIKKTLMAFETRTISSSDENDSAEREEKVDRPVVKKLSNLNAFLNRQNSDNSESLSPAKPLAVRRSESLMLRLKKYESRIAGEQVIDDENDDDENANKVTSDVSQMSDTSKIGQGNIVPKKLAFIDLSSLKNQWETGDISKRRADDDGNVGDSCGDTTGDNCNGHSPSAEKYEELLRIRQQLARKRSGGSSSIKNIYENAIKESQQTQTPRLKSSDLSALNGLSTTGIQQQLLQNGFNDSHKSSTPSTPNKDHFQLNLNNRANKLRERFEQGLIDNSSHDDSDENEGDNERTMSKLEQIRQEKLEDLSVFTEGEIKAREARNMFQQIDRRLSAESGQRRPLPLNSRSLATVSASMQAKLQNQTDSSASNSHDARANMNSSHIDNQGQSVGNHKPIRLLNNVRT